MKINFDCPKQQNFVNQLVDTISALFQHESALMLTEHLNKLTNGAIAATDEDNEPQMGYFEAVNAVKTSTELTQTILRLETSFSNLRKTTKTAAEMSAAVLFK